MKHRCRVSALSADLPCRVPTLPVRCPACFRYRRAAKLLTANAQPSAGPKACPSKQEAISANSRTGGIVRRWKRGGAAACTGGLRA